MKPFYISYVHKGSEWGLEIIADDIEDAKQRLKALGTNGQVLGKLIVTLPGTEGWWVPFVCWVRNLFGARP